MNVRAIAAISLERVLSNGESLSTVLPLSISLTPIRDHSLLKELCYGVCRWYYKLEYLLNLLVKKQLKPKEKTIHALLLIGLYQIWYTNIPDYAVVSETTEAVKQLKKIWAVKITNAVLRTAYRNKIALNNDINKKLIVSHPRWLIEQLKMDWPSFWQDIIEENNKYPPFTIRVNIAKASMKELSIQLEKIGEKILGVPPLVTTALILNKVRKISKLSLFSKGLISVQDTAAQLAAPLLNLLPGQRVLDACAAPGGKTGHILEMQPNICLTALDIDQKRMEKVKFNLDRLKLSARLVIGNVLTPSTWWDGIMYDRILLDAPCSATGVIRRHPDIRILRRENDIKNFAKLQLDMLISLWSLLISGGQLLYVTCSVLRKENEVVIGEFLSKHSDAQEICINADWGNIMKHGRQILPGGSNNTDGFYYASLCKK